MTGLFYCLKINLPLAGFRQDQTPLFYSGLGKSESDKSSPMMKQPKKVLEYNYIPYIVTKAK